MSTDSFSGFLNYPASMNPYQYAYNNPLLYVDPSGNTAFLAMQYIQTGQDLYSMVSQYANRNCTTVKQLATNVLAGAASIAAGIAVGAVVGALGVALLPGSLLAAVIFGAAGGVLAGQYSRLVSNLILGRDPTEGMFNPSDMLIEGVLGGLGGAAGFLSTTVLKATGGGLALALGLTVSVDVGIGELAYAANQGLHGEEYEFSWHRVALNAAISATTFGIGHWIGIKFAERSAKKYNSSYSERFDQTPITNGTWSGKRGESLFTPKNSNALRILKSLGLDGIMYSDAIPDFKPVSIAEVTIGNMTNNRPSNFRSADSALAQELGITTQEVKGIRLGNDLTWHELNDMKTMQLIPSIINQMCGHLGGVGEINIINRMNSNK